MHPSEGRSNGRTLNRYGVAIASTALFCAGAELGIASISSSVSGRRRNSADWRLLSRPLPDGNHSGMGTKRRPRSAAAELAGAGVRRRKTDSGH